MPVIPVCLPESAHTTVRCAMCDVLGASDVPMKRNKDFSLLQGICVTPSSLLSILPREQKKISKAPNRRTKCRVGGGVWRGSSQLPLDSGTPKTEVIVLEYRCYLVYELSYAYFKIRGRHLGVSTPGFSGLVKEYCY